MFSKNLKYLRESRNMEQLELAKKLGKKSSSTISEWENGKYTPRIGVLNDIAEIFNISISDLMNSDLSTSDNSIDIEHAKLFSKLNHDRKMNVHSFARKELMKQDSILDPANDSDTLAAHLVDPEKEFTDQEIDDLKEYLNKAKKEYFEKRNK